MNRSTGQPNISNFLGDCERITERLPNLLAVRWGLQALAFQRCTWPAHPEQGAQDPAPSPARATGAGGRRPASHSVRSLHWVRRSLMFLLANCPFPAQHQLARHVFRAFCVRPEAIFLFTAHALARTGPLRRAWPPLSQGMRSSAHRNPRAHSAAGAFCAV